MIKFSKEKVKLVDLNAAFGNGDGYLNPEDGLHLSDAGGDLMALIKAAKATDDPMEMVLGFLFLAGLVWYFCFR